MADRQIVRESREEGSITTSTLLDKLEQISKISVPIMIPIAVAIIGLLANNFINDRQNIIEQKKVDLEYVKIAKEIVTNVKPETDDRIVNWAYKTLFQLSPVKITQEDVEDLAKKRAPLPSDRRPPVIGGTPAIRSEWPWLVGINNTKSHPFISCNGTLLTSKIVLTSAHCVEGLEPNSVEILIPAQNLSALTIGSKLPVAKIFIHPHYSRGPRIEHDIAIVELSKDSPPPFVRISTDPSTDPETGSPGLIAALSQDSEGSRTLTLFQATMPVVSTEMCLAAYEGQISNTHICAGFVEGGVDACQGAAGGPLVTVDKYSRKYQVGIVSWGEGCALPLRFGVYTRVSSYVEWIEQIAPGALDHSKGRLYR